MSSISDRSINRESSKQSDKKEKASNWSLKTSLNSTYCSKESH